MATIDDLAAPEFAPIRANLARLYLQHLADLGMADASDESVIAQVDDITAVLKGLTARALANRDRAWLVKHAWFGVACQQLLHDQPATASDRSIARVNPFTIRLAEGPRGRRRAGRAWGPPVRFP